MNDRIYNLSLLADQYAHSICDRDEHADWYQTRDQKFAELIVRECIGCGNDLAKHYISNHSEQEQAFLLAAIADYSNEIKKYFGVK